MAFLTADVTEIPDGLGTFAHQQLEQIARSLQGLSREQLAAIPSASGMSLGALSRHVIMIAEQGADSIAAAPAAPERSGSRTPEQAFAEGMISPDALRPEDTAETLGAEILSAADALATAIRQAEPSMRMPAPDEPWFGGRTSWLVLWFALHQIEEFARHAGHADILRESLDGKISYELNALADGETWPPAGW